MTKLKPGQYIVIDPCYIFPDEEWSDFCFHLRGGKADKNSKISFKESVMTYKKIDFIVCSTAYGDGCYPLLKGERFIASLGVDAGLLSIIPLRLAKTWPEFEKNKYLGSIIVVEKECEFKYDGGDFSFGDFSVKTKDDY